MILHQVAARRYGASRRFSRSDSKPRPRRANRRIRHRRRRRLLRRAPRRQRRRGLISSRAARISTPSARTGLRVDSVHGDMHLRPARATERLAAVGPVDAVLLGVKTWQVAEVAPALRRCSAPTRSSCRCKTASRRRRCSPPTLGAGTWSAASAAASASSPAPVTSATSAARRSSNSASSTAARVGACRAPARGVRGAPASTWPCRTTFAWRSGRSSCSWCRSAASAPSRAHRSACSWACPTRASSIDAACAEIAAVARAPRRAPAADAVDAHARVARLLHPGGHLIAAARPRGRQALRARRVDRRGRAARRRSRRADAAARLSSTRACCRGAARSQRAAATDRRPARRRANAGIQAPSRLVAAARLAPRPRRQFKSGVCSQGVPSLVAHVRARLDAPASRRRTYTSS